MLLQYTIKKEKESDFLFSSFVHCAILKKRVSVEYTKRQKRFVSIMYAVPQQHRMKK